MCQRDCSSSADNWKGAHSDCSSRSCDRCDCSSSTWMVCGWSGGYRYSPGCSTRNRKLLVNVVSRYAIPDDGWETYIGRQHRMKRRLATAHRGRKERRQQKRAKQGDGGRGVVAMLVS